MLASLHHAWSRCHLHSTPSGITKAQSGGRSLAGGVQEEIEMRVSTRLALWRIGGGVIAAAMLCATTVAQSQQRTGARWVTAWGTSQSAVGMQPVTNATARLIARVTIPGQAIRIRLDNTFGTSPVTIGAAYAGIRASNAALVAGSNRPVTFRGAATTVIPAGGTVESDQIALSVMA